MTQLGDKFSVGGMEHTYLNAGLPEGADEAALEKAVCPKCKHGYAELIGAPEGTVCSDCRTERAMRRTTALSRATAGGTFFPGSSEADLLREKFGFRWERVRRIVRVPH